MSFQVLCIIMTSENSDFSLVAYATDLEKLGRSDLQFCDIDLLKSYIDMLGYDASHENANLDAKMLINLYVENLCDKVGPIKLPCIAKWTGKVLKQKCSEYFKFPIEYQTLLVNSVVLSDQQTLFDAGIRKTGDNVSVFLHKAYQNAAGSDSRSTRAASTYSESKIQPLAFRRSENTTLFSSMPSTSGS